MSEAKNLDDFDISSLVFAFGLDGSVVAHQAPVTAPRLAPSFSAAPDLFGSVDEKDDDLEIFAKHREMTRLQRNKEQSSQSKPIPAAAAAPLPKAAPSATGKSKTVATPEFLAYVEKWRKEMILLNPELGQDQPIKPFGIALSQYQG
jgi:hypothetical protein